MKKISCAGVLFFDEKHHILLEDRRKIKKHGEHWSFFGGSMEPGETPEQTMLREIREELNHSIKKYSFFKKYTFTIPEKDLAITYHMYTSKIPLMNKIKVHTKAKCKIFTIKQAIRLHMTAIDKKILQELESWITKQHTTSS